MKRQQSILVSSVLIVGIFSFSAGWFFAKNIGTNAGRAQQTIDQSQAQENPDPLMAGVQIRDINEVWKILQDSYYDASKMNLPTLEYGAVKGFVAGIADPYTVFMTPEESQDFENGLEGQLEGIGAELEVREGRLIVVTPIKDSPAEKSGILAGDIIWKIDGELAEEMTIYEAIRRIRGPKGTRVTLTIVRENKPEPFDVTITRSEITIESVTVKKLDGDIFHVTINQFNDHTKREFDNAIQRMLLEKASGMILDLRGNGGGYFDTAVDILSELLQGKKPAVIIKKRNQENEASETSGNAKIADIPLVVLVNKGSASASEIVAGAVQDYKRGILIGEKTFGKGSVQEIDQLPDGSSLRMTIAKWFTPLDRSIDEVGITPDIEIEMTDEDREQNRDPQLDAAVNHLMSSNRR